MLGISLRNLKSIVQQGDRDRAPEQSSRIPIGEWSSQAENRPRPLCGSLGSEQR
jgi:hypothetical protein